MNIKKFHLFFENYEFALIIIVSHSYVRFRDAILSYRKVLMTTFHLAGFPRVGAKRELKFAQ